MDEFHMYFMYFFDFLVGLGVHTYPPLSGPYTINAVNEKSAVPAFIFCACSVWSVEECPLSVQT